MPLSKDDFRHSCLKKMRSLSHYELKVRDMKLNRALQKQLQGVKNRRILLYHSLGFEADISKTLKFLRKNNRIYSPFMQGKSFKMVPYRLPLRKSKFGIFEAGKSLKSINKVDIAIVPVVGVDRQLKRVGFGKGMYDRFFEKLKKRPFTIFVQPRLCYTQSAVCDGYDIQSDLIVTPHLVLQNRLHSFNKERREHAKRSTNWWLSGRD
ncbi:MAG: 5-formyltetrahydrofolate cyclo-ligase [Sulfuricurvum sp.]